MGPVNLHGLQLILLPPYPHAPLQSQRQAKWQTSTLLLTTKLSHPLTVYHARDLHYHCSGGPWDPVAQYHRSLRALVPFFPLPLESYSHGAKATAYRGRPNSRAQCSA